MGNLFAGVDIGGTNLRLALVDKHGRILLRRRMTSDIGMGLEAFVERLACGIEMIFKDGSAGGNRLLSVGAGVPGLIAKDGMIHSSVNMRPLEGANLSALLEARTGVRFFCANDANVIAAGEHVFGAGKNFSSFMVITIGTGLGSGLVLDGRLWSGSAGFASEFGHITMDPDGPLCQCGNRGCLEQYVSAGAIVRAGKQIMTQQGRKIAASLDAESLSGLARSGDEDALEAFRQTGAWLGMGLASLVNILDLEAVIISGGVSASLDLMLPAVRETLKSRAFPQMAGHLEILKGELGDDAGLLGGAALAADCIGSRFDNNATFGILQTAI